MTDSGDDSMGENGALARVFRRLRDAFSPSATEGPGQPADSPSAPLRLQVAALCWRRDGNEAEILLITSRDTGRWILPKGWIEEDEVPWKAAAREAWEEAGAEGKVSDSAFGRYLYRKAVPGSDGIMCCVDVYALEVTRIAKDWPERRQRERRWVSARKAAKLVAEPDLGELLRHFGETRRAAA